MTKPQQMPLDARYLPVAEILPNPDNIRHDLGDLDDLAQSIKDRGVLEPVVVYELPTGWMLIYGHRRLAAAHLAGVKDIPALVRAEPDAATLTEQMLAENLHRSSLDPIDEALALTTIKRESPAKSIAKIALAVNRTPEWVAQRMALVTRLPDAVWPRVRSGDLTITDAVAIAQAKGLKDTEKIALASDPQRHWKIGEMVTKAANTKRRADAVATYGADHVVEYRPGADTTPFGVVAIGTGPGELNVPAEIHAGSCDGARVSLANHNGPRGKLLHFCVAPEVHDEDDFVSGPPPTGDVAVTTLSEVLANHKEAVAVIYLRNMYEDVGWELTRLHDGCPNEFTVSVPWSPVPQSLCLKPKLHNPTSRAKNKVTVEDLRDQSGAAIPGGGQAGGTRTDSLGVFTDEMTESMAAAVEVIVDAVPPVVVSALAFEFELGWEDGTTVDGEFTKIISEGIRNAWRKVMARGDADPDTIAIVEWLCEGALAEYITDDHVAQIGVARATLIPDTDAAEGADTDEVGPIEGGDGTAVGNFSDADDEVEAP